MSHMIDLPRSNLFLAAEFVGIREKLHVFIDNSLSLAARKNLKLVVCNLVILF